MSADEDSQVVILVLIGLPGAGKTSFVDKYKTWLSNNPDRNMALTHISYDHLVPLDIQKKTVDEPGLWKQLRTDIHQAVDLKLHELFKTDCDMERNQFYDKIKIEDRESHGKKKVLVIDDNNQLSSMRYPYFQMARRHKIGFCQLHLTTEIQTALRLNKGRTGQVPDHVITNMAASLEPPDPLKNHWEKFSFSIMYNQQAEDTNYDLIHGVVEMALKNPEKLPPDDSEARERDRRVCSASVVHQADKHLRSIVSKKMKSLKDQNLSKESMKEESKKYNDIKQEVLEDMKTGFTKLDSNLVDKLTEKKSDYADELFSVVTTLFQQKLDLQQ